MRSELANIDNAEYAGAVTGHEQLWSVLANETRHLALRQSVLAVADRASSIAPIGV
jgi:hypothetical protein